MSDKKRVPKLRFPGFTEPWEQRKLGEIATYRNGKAHEANQLDVGTYELVNLNSISIDGGLKPSGKFIEDGSDTLQRNDLVMVLSDVGHGDLLGRVAIIPENNRYVLNQRVALLRINDDTNTYFLFSIINRYQDYFKKLGAGSSQLNISRGIVENFEVAYPNVAEQRMIADYFQSLDHLITLHQRKLEHVKKMKKSMLQKMFPKKNQLYPEVRFPGFTDAWEQRKLGDIAKLKQGIQVDLERQYTEKATGRERFIRIVDYTQSTDDIRYIDKTDNANYVDEKDIVVVRYGATAGFVGRGITGIIANNMFTINPLEELDKEFLYTYMKQEKMYNYLNLSNGSSAMPAINFGIMKSLDISYPSTEEQQQIGAYFSNLDHLITLHQRELDHLQLLKKGMLQQMFI